MVQRIIKFKKQLVELLEELLSGITELLKQIGESNIHQWFQQAWDKINEYYQTIKSWSWDDFTGYFTGAFENFIDAVTGLYEYLSEFVESIDWSTLVEFAQEVVLPLIFKILEIAASLIGLG